MGGSTRSRDTWSVEHPYGDLALPITSRSLTSTSVLNFGIRSAVGALAGKHLNDDLWNG